MNSPTLTCAVTIHESSYDGRGRRLKKVVTNAGQYDGTVVFYYDGWKIIETRDGSGNLYQQFIHGTQYIDELVMMRVKDKGDLYVHQDANWNVIALTDLGGSVVQRNTYTPYGQMTVHQGTSFGDRDGDLDVDATDKGTPGSTLSESETHRVFERFWRADSSHREAHKNRCGLGLPLCQAVSAQLGGSIEATPGPDGIFNATVRLPYALSPRVLLDERQHLRERH